MNVPSEAQTAIEWVIYELEGGDKYTDDPNDPGGPTKYGIAQTYHEGVDVKNLTEEQAIQIYYDEYWFPANLDALIDPRVAKQVLGFCVHIGRGRAIKVLQQCLRVFGFTRKLDGVLGPRTAEAVNSTVSYIMVPVFKEAMAGWYRAKKGESHYIEGFLNRAYNDG